MPDKEEFLAKAESKTSVAASPCIGEVGREPAQEVTAKAALEEEVDEEEENPDVHFKRKRKSFPSKEEEGWQVIWSASWNPQIKDAEASAVYVPPPAPPVPEPRLGEDPGKFIPVIGNIIPFNFSTCFRD